MTPSTTGASSVGRRSLRTTEGHFGWRRRSGGRSHLRTSAAGGSGMGADGPLQRRVDSWPLGTT
eukprot:7341066-Prymnesium_polylepis.2